MKSIIYILLLAIFSPLYVGCGENTSFTEEYKTFIGTDITKNEEALISEELIEWVENGSSGLMVEKEIDEYRFSAFYKPLDYIVAKDLNNNEIKGEELLQEKSEIEDFQYFTFRIGLKSNQGDLLENSLHEANEYYARIEYFSFAMQKDIVLYEGQDTLKCMLYHFERNYGTAPFLNFNLAFEKSLNKEDKTLIIDDQVLGVGRIKLTIPKENITRIPKLKTS